MHVTRTQLQEYADRILDEAQAREIEMHVQGCQQCRAALASFRRLENVIKKIPLERTSADFTQRVMNAVGVARSRNFARQLFLNFLPLVFVALLIAGAVVFVDSSSRETVSHEGAGYAQTFAQEMRYVVSAAIALVLDWTVRLVGISTSIPFIKLVVGLLIAFALVAIFDEFVFLPMMKKRN